MGKKNWIEFDNQEKKSEETPKVDTFNKRSKIRSNKKFCKISTFCFWDRSNYWHNNIFIQ